MQSVILPPSQRRLRHVESICIRNAQSTNAGAVVAPPPAVVVPTEATLMKHRASRIIRPRAATTTTRIRTRFTDAAADLESETPGAATVAELPSTCFQLVNPTDGTVLFESEVQCHTLHPTFAPLPLDVAKSWVKPTLRFLLFEIRGAERQCIHDCVVDFRKLQFQSRNLSSFALHSSQTVVLFKCEDGVFATTPVKPDPSPSLTSAGSTVVEAKRAGSDSDGDNWDVVDGDVIRDEERRLQVAQRLNSAEVLSLAAASTALCFAKAACDEDTTVCRRLALETVQSLQQDGVGVAASSLTVLSSCATSNALLGLQAECAAARKRVAEKAEQLARRRATVAEDETNVALQERWTLPSLHAETAFVAWRKRRQEAMLVRLTEMMPFDGVKMGGFALPPNNDPETEEHNIALSMMAQCFVAICRIFFHDPPHPVTLGGSRAYVAEHAADDHPLPFFVANKNDKVGFAQAQKFFLANIVVAAHAIHGQRQAEGLPLSVAFQKLLHNR